MSSKAHELLLAAAQTKLPGERDRMVQQVQYVHNIVSSFHPSHSLQMRHTSIVRKLRIRTLNPDLNKKLNPSTENSIPTIQIQD